MKHYRCHFCGLVARMSMTDWIAHRLDNFSTHRFRGYHGA